MLKRPPRDGLRARCPLFQARISYLGRAYIRCGGKTLKFPRADFRDLHYLRFCCNHYENCRICQDYRAKSDDVVAFDGGEIT